MDSEVEIRRLRRVLRDLVALSTIPAAWVGRDPPAIAAGLADVLVGALHLDFAFVRLCDPSSGADDTDRFPIRAVQTKSLKLAPIGRQSQQGPFFGLGYDPPTTGG